MEAGSTMGNPLIHEQLNKASPLIMHVDLNSCFAMVEQQARPSLRGKPVAVTNRMTANATIVACSYEAKARGVKGGMSHQEASSRAPDIVFLETDPPKYHYVYQKLVTIMKDYSPDVVMNSIDEGVIDFSKVRWQEKFESLEAIGRDIKQRLKNEVGCWITCNIGIATNRTLAKTAAGMNKPDGLTRIDHTNIVEVFSNLKLTDFPGIANRFEHRLNLAGIFTPLQFLEASNFTLRRIVFKGIWGLYWYQRLRGFEAGGRTTQLGVAGRQFVLDHKTNDEAMLATRFHHLCQSTAVKLRYNEVDARGVLVWVRFVNGESFVRRQMFRETFYTDQEVYLKAKKLFDMRSKYLKVSAIGVSCYKLSPSHRGQMSLLEDTARSEDLTQAVDEVNDRYGRFMITYANALEGKKVIKQKIPFGSTKYFKLLCR